MLQGCYEVLNDHLFFENKALHFIFQELYKFICLNDFFISIVWNHCTTL